MRLRYMVVVGAAVLALTAVTGCGGDDGADGNGNGSGGAVGSSGGSSKGGSSGDGGDGAADDGYGQSAGSGGRLIDPDRDGPPSAPTMAAIEMFVLQYTTCTGLVMQEKDYEDSDFPYPEEAGATWGIRERAICFNDQRNSVRLMAIDDMKKFQTQAKKQGGEYFVGKDFAVASGTSETRSDLRTSGLLMLACDPDEPIPSGYKQEKSLVDGCTLTDFIS
ncbi:hypothetical protein G3I54_29790 [Streptomyces sp. SID14515]|nr:hypothetical protein [Streptomyces sp. SID14515]NEB41052.1 hypothetical protein [Streptomyces sp. SID14515]